MTSIDSQSRPSLAPGTRLQADKLTAETVLLYPEGVIELNGTAHAILNLCNGATTVDEIVKALGLEYEVEEKVLRADALECLGELLQRNVLVLK